MCDGALVYVCVGVSVFNFKEDEIEIKVRNCCQSRQGYLTCGKRRNIGMLSFHFFIRINATIVFMTESRFHIVYICFTQ